MTTNNVRSAYAGYFKVWSTKLSGPQPTDAELAWVHSLGLKPGDKHTIACAMYARAAGATSLQVITVAGGQQLNRMRGLTRPGGPAVRLAMPDLNGHTVYRIVPAKAVAKARKAKAKAAVAVAAVAAPIAAPKAKPVAVTTAAPEPQGDAS